MTQHKRLLATILAGWPLAALPLAYAAMYFGAIGIEPYFLIALGAVMACGTNAAAVMITFGSNQ